MSETIGVSKMQRAVVMSCHGCPFYICGYKQWSGYCQKSGFRRVEGLGVNKLRPEWCKIDISGENSGHFRGRW